MDNELIHKLCRKLNLPKEHGQTYTINDLKMFAENPSDLDLIIWEHEMMTKILNTFIHVYDETIDYYSMDVSEKINYIKTLF